MKLRPLFTILLLISAGLHAQETWFFSDGTSTAFYDQGLVDKGNLGGSTFEFTYPPGYPQYNDKVPCSTTALKGTSSLKFNYTSAANGNWKVKIFRSGWSATDISGMDSLALYIYSAAEVPAAALPQIALVTLKTGGSDEISSKLFKLSDYNGLVSAGQWKRITFPLKVIMTDPASSGMNFSSAKAVVFNQSETNGTSRTLLIDEITAFISMAVVPPVTGLRATGYDSHADLQWTQPGVNLWYRVYASFDNGQTFGFRGETTDDYYLDFVPENGRNKTVIYRVATSIAGKESELLETTAVVRDFSDDELLDMVEYYAFRYFWDGAHQSTGMALERSNGSATTVASGGTGMGLMAMIAAHERQYKPRGEIKERIIKILSFLETCPRPHGAWAHWYNASTGQIQPFSDDDDGGDLVETSFVAQALIALKNYFTGNDTQSVLIRDKADLLWKGIEWDWYRQNNQNVLYWHWSPTKGFKINMKISGWNECLVTYIMAASSPTHGIPKEVYTHGWAKNGNIVNSRTYYNYTINLSPDWGGPLFWLHYTHLGINPHGLRDTFADYWNEHMNTVLIHHAYAVANPKGHTGYSDKCWGLTASDDPYGYTAHQPGSNDNGTISPTAALASMPYAPSEAMKALKYFYRERGKDLFGKFGPYDAFNDNLGWVKKAWLAIDQGPIAVMIENQRTGLLWKNVMKDPDVQAGLTKLGFQFITTSAPLVRGVDGDLICFPNPADGLVTIGCPVSGQPFTLTLYAPDGRPAGSEYLTADRKFWSLNCSGLPNGIYLLRVTGGQKSYHSRLMIQH